MKTSEFIAEARDEIYMGWTKKAFRNDQGVCVIGALDRVALRHLVSGGARNRALAQIELKRTAAEMFPDVFHGSIPLFNDNSQTTKDDVLALMDKATIGLEEKGL